MEEQNNKNEQLTNAQLELQADAAGPSEVKRISYAGLIARRFFRQRSAVVGLTILGILVLLAIFGPLICKFGYTDPDFTAINVAPTRATGLAPTAAASTSSPAWSTALAAPS